MSSWHDLPLDSAKCHSDHLHVFRVNLKRCVESPHEDWGDLTSEELTRARRYVVEPPRQRFLRCRRALRRCLGWLTDTHPADVQFATVNNGKPVLQLPAVSSLQFNVSHSGDWGVIAVAWDRELGIDIETIDPALDVLGLADRFFSPAETRELHKLPVELQRAAFYRLWTSKEAYMKATGLGMLIPLGSFTMRANPEERPQLLDGDASAEVWNAEGFQVADDVPGVLIWTGDSTSISYWNAPDFW